MSQVKDNNEKRENASGSPPIKLARRDDEIRSCPGFIPPLLPAGKLDFSVDTSISHSKEIIIQDDFFSQGFSVSLPKVLMEDTLAGFDLQMHETINFNCSKFMQKCIFKLAKLDSIPVLEVLAMIFDPNIKFHAVNADKSSEYTPLNFRLDKLCARSPPYPEYPHGWLVDLINRFGVFGGFIKLRARFSIDCCPTVPVIRALLRPFRICKDLLTDYAITTYFIPIAEILPNILLKAMDDRALQKVENMQSIRQDVFVVVEDMKSIISCLPKQEKALQILDFSKLSTILCLHPISDGIFDSVAREIFFLVPNDYLDYFLQCLKTSWLVGDQKGRENLIKFIQRLMAKEVFEDSERQKLLMLFWDIAHLDDISVDDMDQALNAQIQILNHLLPKYRDIPRMFLIGKCIEELEKSDDWTLPALKHIRNIYSSIDPKPDEPVDEVYYREDVFRLVKNQPKAISRVANNLERYMDKVRKLVQMNPETKATVLKPDGRYNHLRQVQERLVFLTYIADKKFLLGTPEIPQIWRCLSQKAVFKFDRDICKKWFFNLLS